MIPYQNFPAEKENTPQNHQDTRALRSGQKHRKLPPAEEQEAGEAMVVSFTTAGGREK
jgi:hypothetical protein